MLISRFKRRWRLPGLIGSRLTPRGRAWLGVTGTGAVYLLLLLLLALVAVRSGSNQLYAVLAVMLSALIVSSVISRNALKQLTLTLRTPDRVFAGTIVPTRVALTNRKRYFPLIALWVEENSPGRLDDTPPLFFPLLRAGETRSGHLVQAFPQRGWRRQTLWVSTRFPFGFFYRREALPARELLVYPRPGPLPPELSLPARSDGQRESQERGAGEDFFSIREYHDGESARAIDWKATAKTGRLMAREYAREEAQRRLLILDTYTPTPTATGTEAVWLARFEELVSLTATLAAHFLRAGGELEFFTPTELIAAGRGEKQLYRILEVLALVRLDIPRAPGPSGLLSLLSAKTREGREAVPPPASYFPDRLPDSRRVRPGWTCLVTLRAATDFSPELRRAVRLVGPAKVAPTVEFGLRPDA